MDHRLASVIGYESGQGRLYGYSQNKQTIMMNDGSLWTTVMDTILAEDKLKPGWISAKLVTEDASAVLDKIYPHYTYTIDNWGGTYNLLAVRIIFLRLMDTILSLSINNNSFNLTISLPLYQ